MTKWWRMEVRSKVSSEGMLGSGACYVFLSFKEDFNKTQCPFPSLAHYNRCNRIVCFCVYLSTLVQY